MLTQRKRKLLIFAVSLFVSAAAVVAHYRFDPWGYYRKVSPKEAIIRETFLRTAENYLGYQESDNSHQAIIDLYNSHEPLAVGYRVTYTDSWCSAFVSAVSIQCGLTEIIPTECGCERHIKLFQELGTWVESDDYIPLPGDLIFYDWDMEERGECTGWSDHVGIVVGTKWPFLKVIEGNYEDRVQYRYLMLNDIRIRGFAAPDFASLANKTP